MKVMSVIGTRPQFVKSAPVSWALAKAGVMETVVHTGQHYDDSMSGTILQQLGMGNNFRNLSVGSGSHGEQTAKMLVALEHEMVTLQPDCVVVYGDTNTTLAAALAAVKLRIRIAHIEAGLRSFNKEMPEEHNRVLTDHCSDLLFCPTPRAVMQLAEEGIRESVYCVGDVMYDAFLSFSKQAEERKDILDQLGLSKEGYILTTLHRPYNVDIPERLCDLLGMFGALNKTVVFPVHPRTRKHISSMTESGILELPENVLCLEPLGYLEMLAILRCAELVMTDSGGLQKEAFWARRPCITIRPETEWKETVEAGWNIVGVMDAGEIARIVREHQWPESDPPAVFGDGRSAEKIVQLLQQTFA